MQLGVGDSLGGGGERSRRHGRGHLDGLGARDDVGDGVHDGLGVVDDFSRNVHLGVGSRLQLKGKAWSASANIEEVLINIPSCR